MIPAQRTGAHDDVPYSPETLAAARTGDPEAFAELWRAHHGAVLAYVYKRVADYATAEDIAAETFARAMRRAATFGEIRGAGMIGWLITIARNIIADLYKSSRHRMEFPCGEMLDSDVITGGPEDDVLGRIQDAALREAIARLTPDQRACIEHRFLADLSVAATAQALGKNEGAIKTLQYRAVRTLGRLIAGDPALADAQH